MLLGIFTAWLCLNATFAQTAANYGSTKDAQVSSANSGTNYGTLNTSNVSVVTSSDYFRGYYWFNLTSIPATAVIVSAKFQLTPTGLGESGSGASSFIAQGVTGSWTETGVNFGNQPTVTTTNQQTVSALTSGKREFDVTAMIQAHVSGTTTLTGIMIKRASETTTVTPCQYHTREAATSTDRPAVLISWYDPVRITAATVNFTTSMGSSDGAVTPTVAGGSSSAGAASLTYQWYTTSGTISGATTSSISGKTAGCYGLTITPTYGPVYPMMFLVGTRCEIITMDVIKDPIFVDDAQVWSNGASANTNYGTLATMQAGRPALGTHQFFLRYPIWPDPSNSFYNVTQYLFGSAHSTTINQSIFYRVTSNWVETGTGGVTWNTKPSIDLTTPTPINVASTSSTTENKVLDLTSFFQYWQANPTTTFGYSLVGAVPPPTVSTYQQYHSSDATTAANRPYLTVKLDDALCDRFSYYAFKPQLDASYTTTDKGKLRVQFMGEYQEGSNRWEMRLYDNSHVLKAAISSSGTAIMGAPLLPAVVYANYDNRTTLNLSTLGLIDGGFYVLELTRSTGEKEYVEFIYKN